MNVRFGAHFVSVPTDYKGHLGSVYREVYSQKPNFKQYGGRVYVTFPDHKEDKANRVLESLSALFATFPRRSKATVDKQTGDTFDPRKTPGHAIPEVHLHFPGFQEGEPVITALEKKGIHPTFSTCDGLILEFRNPKLKALEKALKTLGILDKLEYRSLFEKYYPDLD